MKICLIHSLYSPYSRGGAEVVVEIIVNELLQQGHEVDLITLGRKNGIQREGKLTVHRIKPLNVFSFIDIDKRPIWLRFFWHPLDVFNLSSYFKVKKILAEEKPQVVMTHNLKGLGYLIPKAIRRAGVRHWHTVHDVQLSRPSGLIIFGQEKPFLVLDKIYEKATRFLFASPDLVISPSNWLSDYYRKRGFFYESKKLILPNPVVFKKMEKPATSSGPKDRINLLFVGQLERHKGILFLIEALKKIKPQNWQLLIIGFGGAEKEVRKAIGNKTRFNFIGRVEHNQLADYYRQADLTVVPSLAYENSPNVIDESLVANVPVLAADIGGVSEIILDNYNGFTFVPANEKNLIEVLEHFLNHPENIEKLKKNCFISVRNFSAANYIKKLLELA